MATITVGIDTSRVYNRKTPPGGKVSDVFSFSSSESSKPTPPRVNRQRSSIDLGGEDANAAKSVDKQNSEPARNPSSTKGKSQATLEPKTKGSESKSTTEKPSPAINNEKQAKEATSGVSGEEAPAPEPSVKPSQPQDAVKESPESEPKPGAYPALVKPSSVPDTTIPEPTLSNAKDPAPVQDEAPAKEAPPPVVRQNSRRDRPP